jgi:hypothetical protein
LIGNSDVGYLKIGFSANLIYKGRLFCDIICKLQQVIFGVRSITEMSLAAIEDALTHFLPSLSKPSSNLNKELGDLGNDEVGTMDKSS